MIPFFEPKGGFLAFCQDLKKSVHINRPKIRKQREILHLLVSKICWHHIHFAKVKEISLFLKSRQGLAKTDETQNNANLFFVFFCIKIHIYRDLLSCVFYSAAIFISRDKKRKPMFDEM